MLLVGGVGVGGAAVSEGRLEDFVDFVGVALVGLPDLEEGEVTMDVVAG